MNVNLDVLELIFGQLDGSDLVASALVSRAFLAGAIPSLYARIEYTTRHAKRAQVVLSPFATLAAHGHLVVHVKRIAVHAAPVFPSSHQISPSFLRDLAHTLRTAANLRSFVCTVKVLPPLLPHLVDKHRLHHLRISASLGSRQMAVLQERTGLQSLSLDFPSWNVIDTMPIWTAGMQKTLAHLTLFMSQDTDATVLNTTLAQLPRLCGLHLIGCPRLTHITVLKALSHTPGLRELSFTIFPSQENALPPLNFSIPLTHLSIDIRASYPGLKSHIAHIISRLSPRYALAICGGWIGEIKASSERADPSQDAGGGNALGGAGPGAAGAAGEGGPLGQNFHVFQSHVHLHGHGHGHGHGNDQVNDPPLLNPAVPHHGNANPTPNPGDPPPNPGNPAPPLNFLGFPFPFPFGNLNGNDNNNNDLPGAGPANPPNPDLNPDLNLPSLVSSFPSAISTLHLPQISPAGLKEVVERCEGIQVLGIVIGDTFASPTSVKASKKTSRIKGHATKSGVRPEVSVLAAILSRARALRVLIIDTSGTDTSGNSTSAGSDTRAGGSHGTSFRGGALLTPLAVRTLMRESPSLRRIVGEGRVWESCTPIPSSPVPFPQCLPIDLTLSKARYGPGAGNNHAHGPPGFGTHGGGYDQVEAGNDHWFWLTDSASGGNVF